MLEASPMGKDFVSLCGRYVGSLCPNPPSFSLCNSLLGVYRRESTTEFRAARSVWVGVP